MAELFTEVEEVMNDMDAKTDGMVLDLRGLSDGVGLQVQQVTQTTAIRL